MGFTTQNTLLHDLIEGQRPFLLGQAIELTSLVWFVCIFLAFQQHTMKPTHIEHPCAKIICSM